MERNIQYLRELTVLRMVYNVDLNNYQLSSNSGSIWCMQTVWWKSVQSSPLLNANSLAVMAWKDRDEQTGNELVTNSDNTKKISSFKWVCISVVDKVSQEILQLIWNISFSPPAHTSISVSRSKHFSVQLRRYNGYTPSATT